MDQLWSVAFGGAVALAGGAATTALQAWLQRRAAREDYLWNKRAELYLDVLRHGNGQIAHTDDDDVDEQYGWTPETEELRQDLTARVQLFGSPAVEERWRRASEAGRALDFYATENLLVERGQYAQRRSDAGEDPVYVRRSNDAKEARRLLAEQLRLELRTDRHLKRAA
ncbi:hypothetical protein GCM10010317_076600 [Streptomyces mirabilis]|uniref:hypothetical protein n=1 Tax=Streptomyces mirabilis TaxID=68239 RepID=UPI00167E59A2|nr:hypothetical protein [Streptomyces mirabilis]GHD70078.1 hypothetical protein GCM10010317_076600 [Streptomyces mirabilis]